MSLDKLNKIVDLSKITQLSNRSEKRTAKTAAFAEKKGAENVNVDTHKLLYEKDPSPVNKKAYMDALVNRMDFYLKAVKGYYKGGEDLSMPSYNQVVEGYVNDYSEFQDLLKSSTSSNGTTSTSGIGSSPGPSFSTTPPTTGTGSGTPGGTGLSTTTTTTSTTPPPTVVTVGSGSSWEDKWKNIDGFKNIHPDIDEMQRSQLKKSADGGISVYDAERADSNLVKTKADYETDGVNEEKKKSYTDALFTMISNGGDTIGKLIQAGIDPDTNTNTSKIAQNYIDDLAAMRTLDPSYSPIELSQQSDKLLVNWRSRPGFQNVSVSPDKDVRKKELDSLLEIMAKLDNSLEMGGYENVQVVKDYKTNETEENKNAILQFFETRIKLEQKAIAHAIRGGRPPQIVSKLMDYFEHDKDAYEKLSGHDYEITELPLSEPDIDLDISESIEVSPVTKLATTSRPSKNPVSLVIKVREREEGKKLELTDPIYTDTKTDIENLNFNTEVTSALSNFPPGSFYSPGYTNNAPLLDIPTLSPDDIPKILKNIAESTWKVADPNDSTKNLSLSVYAVRIYGPSTAFHVYFCYYGKGKTLDTFRCYLHEFSNVREGGINRFRRLMFAQGTGTGKDLSTISAALGVAVGSATKVGITGPAVNQTTTGYYIQLRLDGKPLGFAIEMRTTPYIALFDNDSVTVPKLMGSGWSIAIVLAPEEITLVQGDVYEKPERPEFNILTSGELTLTSLGSSSKLKILSSTRRASGNHGRGTPSETAGNPYEGSGFNPILGDSSGEGGVDDTTKYTLVYRPVYEPDVLTGSIDDIKKTIDGYRGSLDEASQKKYRFQTFDISKVKGKSVTDIQTEFLEWEDDINNSEDLKDFKQNIYDKSKPVIFGMLPSAELKVNTEEDKSGSKVDVTEMVREEVRNRVTSTIGAK